MSSGYEVDPELLGRLAAQLEETGKALKTVAGQGVAHGAAISSLRTSMDSAHARLKTVETAINGNGNAGMRTEIQLLKRDIESACKDLDALRSWKDGISDKKVQRLEQAQEAGKAKNTQIWLAAVALLVALGSMIGSCGPQWVKAWEPDKQHSAPLAPR